MNLVRTALLWRNTENTSLEYFTLHSNKGCFVMEGTVNLLLEQVPTKVTYRLECDSYWRTKNVHVCQEREGKTSQLMLAVNGNQQWQENAIPLPFAAGLLDVDFEISPATNTLPIRRLGLNIGDSKELDTVWVRFPSLKLERLHQKYTRVSAGCYKYEAPSLGYEARLEVDSAGLILKYGELWIRIA